MPKPFNVATRAQALTLLTEGYPIEVVSQRTTMAVPSIRSLAKKAKDRGFDPKISTIILDAYVEDAPRSGRPVTATTIAKQQELVAELEKTKDSRESTCKAFGDIIGVSAMSVMRMLATLGYNKTKATWKPGLTDAMRAARLAFAIEHEFTDWKNVIFSDETSVILGQRRGKRRTWRTSKEALNRTVIRRRYKGYTEFMWWSCFSYDKKGPYHIWDPETDAEAKAAAEDLERQNEVLEPIKRVEWELNTAMRRTGLRNKPGRAPQWRWNKKNGKLVRDAKRRGVDWYCKNRGLGDLGTTKSKRPQ